MSRLVGGENGAIRGGVLERVWSDHKVFLLIFRGLVLKTALYNTIIVVTNLIYDYIELSTRNCNGL